MNVVFEALLIILGSSIGLIGLGLVTGFSPVLYLAQVAGAAKSHAPEHAMRGLLLGVLFSTIAMGLLFQFFQPSTLAYFFNTTVTPVILSSSFHVLLGLIFIAIGLRALLAKPRIKPISDESPATGAGVLFGAGFAKTLISPSSVLSIFFATQITIHSAGGLVTQIILALIFLVATLAPFIALYILWQKSPEALEIKTNEIVQRLEFIHYRLLIGLITTASGIIIISLVLISQSLS